MVFPVAEAGGTAVGGGRAGGGGKKEGPRLLPLRSAQLRAPTPRCSAWCPSPGHAPPEPPATQNPSRPPEPPQSSLRRMGALGPKPPPPPLLLLMLGKPGSQPRPAGACYLVSNPARLPSTSEPLAPASPSASPGLALSCPVRPPAEPVLGRAASGVAGGD